MVNCLERKLFSAKDCFTRTTSLTSVNHIFAANGDYPKLVDILGSASTVIAAWVSFVAKNS